MSISSTLVDRAEIRFREPAGALGPFVGCFWIVTADRDATIRVVPDGSTSISIQLDHGHPPDWRLRGPLLRPDERRFQAPTTLVGIRLRPGVAVLLTGAPAHTMLDRHVRLRSLAAFQDLVAADLPAVTPERCIEVLEAFLLRRLEHAQLPAAVASALDAIARAHGCLNVDEIAARSHVSARHLNRLMRHWIGYGAKRYASIVRFQATLHEMERTPALAPAALASDNGFFDQSHLTLDLTRFAGTTPGRLATTGVADFSKTRCDDLP